MDSTSKNKELAYAVLRFTLGLNIFMHGIGRFGSNYDKFVTSTMGMFAESPLPTWSLSAFTHLVPIIEVGVGFLLLLGFATRSTAVVGSVLMMTLIFGTTLIQKWDLAGLQMIYVIFYFLVIFFLEYNRYSLDYGLRRDQ